MTTYNNVSQEASDWVSVNSVSSVTVGDAFTLQNNHTGVVYVSESGSKPDINAGNFLRLYPPSFAGLSIINVSADSGEIWVRPETLGKKLELSVQG